MITTASFIALLNFIVISDRFNADKTCKVPSSFKEAIVMLSGGGGDDDYNNSNLFIYLFTCVLKISKANCKISRNKNGNTYTQLTEDDGREQ
jgi:hypothetical protein